MRESLLHRVLKGCRSVMMGLLTRLHSAACLPHLAPGAAAGKLDGQGLELAVGLHEGVVTWCHRILQLHHSNHPDQEW